MEFTPRGNIFDAFGGLTESRLRDFTKSVEAMQPLGRSSAGADSGLALFIDAAAEHVAGAAIIRLSNIVNEFIAFYPVVLSGADLMIDIEEEVRGEDEDDVALYGSASAPSGDARLWLRFFDTHHPLRGNTSPLGARRARVAGIALSARRPHQQLLEMPTPEWMRLLPGRQRPSGDTVEFDLSQMRLWLPDPERHDMAEFRGRVARTHQLGPTYFDEPSWRCDIEVGSNDEDEVFALPFIVTRSALQGEPPPEQGEWMEGVAWVQGRIEPS